MSNPLFPPLTETSIATLAARTVQALGGTWLGEFCAGTDETDHLIFSFNGITYSLEYGGCDYYLPVNVSLGNASLYWDQFGLEPDDDDFNPDIPEPNVVWSLELQGMYSTEQISLEGVNLVNDQLRKEPAHTNELMGYSDRGPVVAMWALSALTAFLWELKGPELSDSPTESEVHAACLRMAHLGQLKANDDGTFSKP